MKVAAIESNDRRRSCFIPMANGAAAGAVTGLVAKYALPLSIEEKSSPEYQKIARKIQEQKSEYNIRTKAIVNNLKAKEDRTLAQDQFVKMFDGLREGDRVKRSSIRTALRTLLEKDPTQVIEFKKMCKASNETVEATARQCQAVYNVVTKHMRPTAFFVISGAVIGAVVAMFNDALKTEVRK